jgi:hypothetical protein
MGEGGREGGREEGVTSTIRRKESSAGESITIVAEALQALGVLNGGGCLRHSVLNGGGRRGIYSSMEEDEEEFSPQWWNASRDSVLNGGGRRGIQSSPCRMLAMKTELQSDKIRMSMPWVYSQRSMRPEAWGNSSPSSLRVNRMRSLVMPRLAISSSTWSAPIILDLNFSFKFSFIFQVLCGYFSSFVWLFSQCCSTSGFSVCRFQSLHDGAEGVGSLD